MIVRFTVVFIEAVLYVLNLDMVRELNIVIEVFGDRFAGRSVYNGSHGAYVQYAAFADRNLNVFGVEVAQIESVLQECVTCHTIFAIDLYLKQANMRVFYTIYRFQLI